MKTALYFQHLISIILLSLINILQNGSKKYQGQNHQKTASPILSMVPRGGKSKEGAEYNEEGRANA